MSKGSKAPSGKKQVDQNGSFIRKGSSGQDDFSQGWNEGFSRKPDKDPSEDFSYTGLTSTPDQIPGTEKSTPPSSGLKVMQHYPADYSRRHSAHPVVGSLYSRYQDISSNSIICDRRSVPGMSLLHLAGRERRSEDSFFTTRHRSNGHMSYIISSRRSIENDRSPGCRCSCTSSTDTAS